MKKRQRNPPKLPLFRHFQPRASFQASRYREPTANFPSPCAQPASVPARASSHRFERFSFPPVLLCPAHPPSACLWTADGRQMFSAPLPPLPDRKHDRRTSSSAIRPYTAWTPTVLRTFCRLFLRPFRKNAPDPQLFCRRHRIRTNVHSTDTTYRRHCNNWPNKWFFPVRPTIPSSSFRWYARWKKRNVRRRCGIFRNARNRRFHKRTNVWNRLRYKSFCCPTRRFRNRKRLSYCRLCQSFRPTAQLRQTCVPRHDNCRLAP